MIRLSPSTWPKPRRRAAGSAFQHEIVLAAPWLGHQANSDLLHRFLPAWLGERGPANSAKQFIEFGGIFRIFLAHAFITKDLLGSFGKIHISRRCRLDLVGAAAKGRIRPRQSDGVAGTLLALLFWPFYKTMEVSGSFSLVLVNPAPKKQFANLGQASAFLLSDLQKGNFDLAGDSESNPFVFGCHKLPGF